jgi:hypothetical protein
MVLRVSNCDIIDLSSMSNVPFLNMTLSFRIAFENHNRTVSSLRRTVVHLCVPSRNRKRITSSQNNNLNESPLVSNESTIGTTEAMPMSFNNKRVSGGDKI